ncbi:protein unc-13 homolog A-like [Carassius auratus]|uniref:Protein unc-13 homolog A-like n=1 Tax=Carassius auratus TaxID=7957 RepID=A0A6P6J3P6_CARAU|nr:protein unc-13 homolog A-like [Carassius auratus]
MHDYDYDNQRPIRRYDSLDSATNDRSDLDSASGSSRRTSRQYSLDSRHSLSDSPTGSSRYASSGELSRGSSQLSEEFGPEDGESFRGSGEFYDENDSYHSCHSSVSYGKDSPGWDPDEPHGVYSDDGEYNKDGGEEGALYDEEDGEIYEQEQREFPYEEEEEGMVYEEDGDLYPLDGTLSEEQEPPYTPTPTSTAPALAPEAPTSRPPLEKQASIHQQQPPQSQPPFQTIEPKRKSPPPQQPQGVFAKVPHTLTPPRVSELEPEKVPTPAGKQAAPSEEPLLTPATENLPEAEQEKKDAPPESTPKLEPPVDPALRAKANWLRLFNRVRLQLQEFFVIAMMIVMFFTALLKLDKQSERWV